jgi:hypothetical protein
MAFFRFSRIFNVRNNLKRIFEVITRCNFVRNNVTTSDALCINALNEIRANEEK